MTKKSLLILLVFIMIGALVSGCGPGPEAPTEEPPETEEPIESNEENTEPAESPEPDRIWIPSTRGLNFEDGTYRGIFSDGGEMQVNVQFSLENNTITSARFRHLAYRGEDYLNSNDETIQGLAEQHEILLDYLVGTDIRSTLSDLYSPGQIVTEEYDVDGYTGATLRANKVISAFRDALNRGVYSTDVVEGYSPLPDKSFEDGIYRGVFADGGYDQVNVQFALENNVIIDIGFRHLFYGGIDYLDSDDEIIQGLTEQHEMLLDYLEGTDIRSTLTDLYSPGQIVTEEYDVDGYTGATLRANKVISAIIDGLNRGIYN